MSTTDQPPKHKRRWYQFSLRTLLVVVTLFTVAFGGWVQFRRQRARKNRDRVAASENRIETAVVAIESMGGKVTSEHEELRPQSWLEKQFDDPGGPDDSVDVWRVTRVDFCYAEVIGGVTYFRGVKSKVTDSDIEYLECLTYLEDLDLSHTQVTDAGLDRLNGLTNLRYLDLASTEVTDAGLKHLKESKGLQYLGLYFTEITDAGLEHLKGLTNLQGLTLVFTKVTDEGVKKLQQALPNCKIQQYAIGL